MEKTHPSDDILNFDNEEKMHPGDDITFDSLDSIADPHKNFIRRNLNHTCRRKNNRLSSTCYKLENTMEAFFFRATQSFN